MGACQYVKICLRTLKDCESPEVCTHRPLKVCSYRIDYKKPQNEPQIIQEMIPVIQAPKKPIKYAHCRICGRPVKETGWRIVQKFSPQCECGSKEMDYDTDQE